MFSLKQIMASALIIIVASPPLFFAGILIQQQQLQHTMKEKLKYASLEIITLEQQEVIWAKPGKEIIIDGKLFDVKSYVSHGNKTVFTGLYDSEEDKLEIKLAGMLHKEKGQGLPLTQLMIKFLFSSVMEKTEPVNLSGPSYKIHAVYLSYSELPVSQSLSVYTPPPNA